MLRLLHLVIELANGSEGKGGESGEILAPSMFLFFSLSVKSFGSLFSPYQVFRS